MLHELEAINPVAGDIQNLVKLFSRFNDFLGSLNSVLPGFEFVVRNEADLQRALTPALRLFARDVRPEDFVPDFGGSRSRTDFFLPDSGIAIETKMTRESLRAGKLRDELIIDFRQYASLGRVQGIVAFVYDPDRRLDNPAALDDLSDLSLDKPTYVYVLSGR